LGKYADRWFGSGDSGGDGAVDASGDVAGEVVGDRGWEESDSSPDDEEFDMDPIVGAVNDSMLVVDINSNGADILIF
jgi:hypothetical protein